MQNLLFDLIAVNVEFSSVDSFSNFNENGPCDMCWGDLSL
jgi:hypothetical protein